MTTWQHGAMAGFTIGIIAATFTVMFITALINGGRER